MIAAMVTLGLFAILIPVLLVVKARHSKRKRDASLALHLADMGAWFEELDEDSSGSLEAEEVQRLLERMRQPSNKKAMRRTMLVIQAMHLQNKGQWTTAQSSTIRRTRNDINAFSLPTSREVRAADRVTPDLRKSQAPPNAVSLSMFENWYRAKCVAILRSPLPSMSASHNLHHTARPMAHAQVH